MEDRKLPLRAYRADGFIGRLQRLVRETVIPYQYQILNDALPEVEWSHAVENLRLAAKKLRGEPVDADAFYGMVFQDSDVAKWMEAAAYTLAAEPNAALERALDELTALYAAAQQADGYLNSYFTVKAPAYRWTNLRDAHELYCAGHLIEAGVAYYEATGKRGLLELVCRTADCLCEQFLQRDTRGCPGHPEVELALVRLWRATGCERYLTLAKHFIDVRGQEPNCFSVEPARGQWELYPHQTQPYDPRYAQCDAPVRQQREAQGHAVRAVYLYTGMAEAALETGDAALMSQCRALWDSIVKRQLYVTGGIGSTASGEAFTVPYDLPNDTVYAETCASVGLMFFARAMLRGEAKGEYADVMERAFYNTVLAGMQLDGKRFFYVNPLESIPGISGVVPAQKHNLPERPRWYACACCPPNAARVISSLGAYAYGEKGGTFFIHLYAAGTVETGLGFALTCRTEYPHASTVAFTVMGEGEGALALRIPGWSQHTALTVCGEAAALSDVTRDGYAYVTRRWKTGDTLLLELDMTPRFVYASPRVAADSGRACLRRGPLVYCAEEYDNGPVLPLLLDRDGTPRALPFEPETLGGIVPVLAGGFRMEWEGDGLYSTQPPVYRPVTIRLIPYYAWANRGAGQMRVWLPLR